MSGLTVNVDVRSNRLPAIAAMLRPRAEAVISKAAHDIEAAAKSQAPVDTGALRNSIQAHPEAALAWVVAVGVEYGIYQEFGTRKMAAQPYLIPAFQRVAPSLIAALKEIVS